jgi:SET domain-containing protein
MDLDKLLHHYQKLTITEEYVTPMATIKYSNKTKGRGVFASVGFKKGDIIEIAPAILQESKHNKGTLLNYTFQYDKKWVMIGFGYTSLYNHSRKNNAYWENIENNKMMIIAKADIKPNEEIFISYGDDYFKDRGIDME